MCFQCTMTYENDMSDVITAVLKKLKIISTLLSIFKSIHSSFQMKLIVKCPHWCILLFNHVNSLSVAAATVAKMSLYHFVFAKRIWGWILEN